MTPFERLMFKEVFKTDGYGGGGEEDMGDYVREKFTEMADSVQREQEQIRRLFQAKRHGLAPQQPPSPSPRALPRSAQPVSSLAQRMQDLHTQRLLREEEEAAAAEEEEDYRGGGNNWWESQPPPSQAPTRASSGGGNWWEQKPPRHEDSNNRHLFHSELAPRYLADTASSRLRRLHREQDAKSRVDFPLAHQAVFPAPLAYASRMGL